MTTCNIVLGELSGDVFSLMYTLYNTHRHIAYIYIHVKRKKERKGRKERKKERKKGRKEGRKEGRKKAPHRKSMR